ncbi:MAG: hypothetical protein ACQEXJ_23315 [Myxococcota bacterium]
MVRPFVIGLALAVVYPTVAHAEVDLRWSGRLQTDIRFRVEDKTQGEWYQEFELPAGVARNENQFKLKLEALSDRWAGVADLDFVWMGIPEEPAGVDDLSLREKSAPWRLETQALYIEAFDIFVDGFDLRIGQQKIFWGAGDQFNPTHNLSAEDLEDPLLFGDQQANVMARADYTPWHFLTFTGILVPVFKPALLPRSAFLGVAAPDRLPFLDAGFRHSLRAQQDFAGRGGKPTVVVETDPELPELSFGNMQWSFAVRAMVGLHDIGLSYYNGRSDMPVPVRNVTRSESFERRCNPDDEEDCIDGFLETSVEMEYPEIQVIGLNMTGPLPLLSWLSDDIAPFGYRLEMGLYIPEEESLSITQEGLPGPSELGPSEVVDDHVFLKWTAGLDYSFGNNVYVNLQWVHGMVDDFGAGDFIWEGEKVRKSTVVGTDDEVAECALLDENKGERCVVETTRPSIPDYIVLGADFKFLNQAGLFRLFTILDVSGVDVTRWDPDAEERVTEHEGVFTTEGFSAIVFPSLGYNFGDGLELSAGAIFKLGKKYTKFGDPAAGGTLAWTQAKYSF